MGLLKNVERRGSRQGEETSCGGSAGVFIVADATENGPVVVVGCKKRGHDGGLSRGKVIKNSENILWGVSGWSFFAWSEVL